MIVWEKAWEVLRGSFNKKVWYYEKYWDLFNYKIKVQ